MKIIYKAPGRAPEVIEIPNTQEALQEKVGGNIETVTFAEDACVICNEEGRLMGLPFNLTFLGRSFVGPVLIVGVEGEDFTDISQAAMGMVWHLLQEV